MSVVAVYFYLNSLSLSLSLQLSAPQKIQELTLQALKTMLEKQQTIFEQLTLDYTKVPSERLEQEVRGKQKDR